ncbi:polysaccharide deacetylase family protein [Orenia marismortui]|uniref:Polysaccharide deacetylase family sporulation protein PdaB n=1 Tax=Orenia marismortui TaxID=46469 RepID=A0A4R8GPJ1_9FIRM|nr:polysaccharide deacetylase family protein [Orenia marismortui]TDX46618.1 polysaccharide deacetylase family sporulation protein PdaB [Orenia marismortui]
MSRRKVKIFYLPLNRDVLLGLIGVVMLLSFGVLHFDQSDQIQEQTVFNPQEKAYYQGPSGKKAMSLTINVAWGEEYLPSMLDTLDKYQVKATFFFIGRWVEKFPDKTKEIKERGHELGNHGYRHLHPKKLSKDKLVKLIKDNEELIYKTTGIRTNLFAPPYGEVDDRISEVASEAGYKTIMWSADTIDWQRPAPEVIINRVLSKAQNGGIVLMHPTKPTSQALAQIIEKLQAKGYKLVTVSELLE